MKLLIIALLLVTLLPIKHVYAENSYTLQEVSKHNKETDCWFILNNNVYNITNYLSSHDNKLNIRPWCGKDVTNDYNTKAGRGEGHSFSADRQLENLLIGKLTQSDISVTDAQTATPTKSIEYNVWLPLFSTILFYFISLKLLKRQSHNLVWNSIMFLGLIPSLVFGLLMASGVTLGIKSYLLYMHVEFSIVFGTACVLHLLLRKQSYISQAKFVLRNSHQ